MLSVLFAGIIYSWSVYVNPLVAKFGWSTGETSIAYTINVVFSALVPILAGKLRARMKINRYCLLGALVYGSGLFLCGFIQSSVIELYLYFGVLVGSGIGFIYLGLAPYVVQLFPDKRGLAAGLFTACYGLAAFFWAPAARYIMSSYGDVSNAFIYLSILMTMVLLLVTRFLYEVPAGWQGDPAQGGAKAAAQITALVEKSPKQLLATPLYYVILLMYTCGLISGMMVLSLGSPIIEGSLSYSPEKAAIIVGFFAVASTGGRLFWGWISDVLGRLNVMIILGAITCLCMIILANLDEEYIFIICLLAVPMCYGAYAATLAPVAVETFGARHVTMNYNLLFIAFGLAALIGPQVIAYVRSSSGGYQGAFFYGTIFAAIAVVLAIISKQIMKSQRAAAKIQQS
jgi:OFA family oxalate/formate antiporter-like MFS transporter